jgi:hypothetical protein
MPFNVVFHGEFSPEYDIDEAKEKLAKLFKLKPETAARLFAASQAVTIRKNVDAATAEKLRQTAARCGVIFDLEPVEEMPKATPAPADPAPGINRVTCPECGLAQSRATTCLQCGSFLIPAEETSRPAPIAKVTVPVTSAEAASGSRKNLWKTARIALLLLVLFIVGMNTVMTGRWTTDWDEPLWVGIYPINGDGNDHVAAYIDRLEEDDFRAIIDFFAEEAEAHALPLVEPFTIRLAPAVKALPPSPPQGRNPLAAIWWSLKMRLWVFQNDTFTDGPSPEIKIFTVYHDARSGKALENSLGLRKGLFGVVHAYADYRLAPKNHVVIAHEILHTVGARDKYDPATRQPLFPDGFAYPDRQPRYPQQLAEIMGSRIPVSQTKATMPPSLAFTLIGKQTAREIKWIEN